MFMLCYWFVFYDGSFDYSCKWVANCNPIQGPVWLPYDFPATRIRIWVELHELTAVLFASRRTKLV